MSELESGAKAPENPPTAKGQEAALDVTSTTSEAEIAALVAQAMPGENPVVEPDKSTEQPTEAQQAEAAAAEAAAAEQQAEATEQAAAKDFRIRIKHLSPEDQAAQSAILELTKGGMSLKDATDKILGNGTQAQQQQQEAKIDPLVAELETQRTELAELVAQRKGEYGGEKLTSDQLEELQSKIEDLKIAVARKEDRIAQNADAQRQQTEREALARAQQSDQQFEAERNQILADVVKDYPQMGDKESPQWKEAFRINQEILANPKHPNRPMLEGMGAPEWLAIQAEKNLAKKGIVVPKGTAPLISQAPQQAKPPGPASGAKATLPPAPVKTPAEQLAELEASRDSIFSEITPSHQRSREIVLN